MPSNGGHSRTCFGAGESWSVRRSRTEVGRLAGTVESSGGSLSGSLSGAATAVPAR